MDNLLSSEEIDQSSAILLSVMELNTNNTPEILESAFECNMSNLPLPILSGDEVAEYLDKISCEETTGSTSDQLETNAKAKSSKRLKPPIIFRCEICLTEVEDDNRLKEHLVGHDFQYSCKTCGEKFKLTLDFIDHVREHRTDKIYKCPLCDFEVEKRIKITSHLQNKHEQFKKFRCDVCKKGMNVYTHFLDHKFIHTNETPFKCDKCDRSFSQNVLLKAHYTRMHIINTMSCRICSKKCRNKIELRSHMNSHEKRSVTCKECGKILSNKDKLRIHSRIHTGEKPYSCKFCPKSFKTSTHLTDHERIHTGEKPHICPICGKGFSQRTSMLTHKAIHLKIKFFQCGTCNKQFESQYLFNGHMKNCRLNAAVQPETNQEVGESFNEAGYLNLVKELNLEECETSADQEVQDLNNANVTANLPLYQVYNYNPIQLATPETQYLLTNSEPTNNYVQLLNISEHQVVNSAQTYQVNNYQPEVVPINFQPYEDPSTANYESTLPLPAQNTHQVLPSEMGSQEFATEPTN